MKRPINFSCLHKQNSLFSPAFKGENGPEPLANLVGRFLEERSVELENSGRIIDAWDKIVPENLRPHCRLGGLQNGILTIEADSGPCLYQLKTLSNEMVRRFRQLCPSAKIQKIRLHPLSRSAKENA